MKNFSVKFDISEIRVISSEELKSIEYDRKISKLENFNVENNDTPEVEEQKGTKVESAGDNVANDLLRQQEYAQELAAVAEFESYGKLTKSTSVPIYLTDKEMKLLLVSSSICLLNHKIGVTIQYQQHITTHRFTRYFRHCSTR